VRHTRELVPPERLTSAVEIKPHARSARVRRAVARGRRRSAGRSPRPRCIRGGSPRSRAWRRTITRRSVRCGTA
jgi:hypothetical protein